MWSFRLNNNGFESVIAVFKSLRPQQYPSEHVDQASIQRQRTGAASRAQQTAKAANCFEFHPQDKEQGCDKNAMAQPAGNDFERIRTPLSSASTLSLQPWQASFRARHHQQQRTALPVHLSRLPRRASDISTPSAGARRNRFLLRR